MFSQEWLTTNQPDWAHMLGLEKQQPPAPCHSDQGSSLGDTLQSPLPLPGAGGPSIEDLLEPPQRSPGGRTEDERVAAIEEQLFLTDQAYNIEKDKIERSIKLDREKQEEYQRKLQQNTEYSRILQSMSEEVLRVRVNDLVPYLQAILDRRVFSQKFEDFRAGGRPFLMLLYSSITQPFTDKQVDIILQVIFLPLISCYKDFSWKMQFSYPKIQYCQVLDANWGRNRQERMQNNDVISRVLLPECCVRLYADQFGCSKEDALSRMNHTPSEL